MAVRITGVEKNSIGQALGIRSGDVLTDIDGHAVNDVLDYGFYTAAERLTLCVARGGRRREFDVEKEEDEDLGLAFETFLMDEQRSCANDCIFCFVNQLPPGLRDTLYFKDDDERLSFLFGNYVTLTNMNDREIERIIDMKVSPINVSVHTTDPALRSAMMGNRFAGEKLRYLYRLAEAGVEINCQIVLCRGVNDGDALRATLAKLTSLQPSVRSIACVPAGLTAFRAGLPAITPYDRESALGVLRVIEEAQARCRAAGGTALVYPADEFFLLAGRDVPGCAYYDEMLQLENGVGMLALLRQEFFDALGAPGPIAPANVDIVTGEAAAPSLGALAAAAQEKNPGLRCAVHAVKNEFFGGNVIVSGLVTATDIVRQLAGRLGGDRVLLPDDMLRSEGDMFLDSVTVEELSRELGKDIAVLSGGAQLADALLGR